MSAEWDESAHPRDEKGMFTSGGGGAGGAGTAGAAKGLSSWAAAKSAGGSFKVSHPEPHRDHAIAGLANYLERKANERGTTTHHALTDTSKNGPAPKGPSTRDREQRAVQGLADYLEHSANKSGTTTHHEISKEGKEHAAAIDKANANRDAFRKAQENAPRKWLEKMPEGLLPKGHAETWEAHFDKNPDLGGVPHSAERKALHDKILHEALGRVKPVAPGDQKHVILTMGGPASGKTSILGNMDTSHFVKVDPDAIKDKIPEYAKATQKHASFRGAANMAHEESSYLAKKLRDMAIKEGKHMIIDGTGAKAKPFVDLIKHLKANGYHVTVMMPHLTADQGLARAQQRAEGSGRYVPDHFVKETYSKVAKNAGIIAKEAHAFKMFDAAKGSKGVPAPLAYEKHPDGTETHHDKAFVDSFRKEHGW